MSRALPTIHREIHLAARPRGAMGPEHFRLVEAPVPEPGPGQLLVRNRTMSVSAVMRTLAQGAEGLPMPSYAEGEVLWGPALGEVVAGSGGRGPGVGSLVTHNSGWREYAVLGAEEVTRVEAGALPDPAAHLSQGFTAWLGVVRGAEVRPGDTVFVTGAAGGVGTLAGQFARLHGAERVIGSTGSRAKGRYLVEELGYDAVVIRGAEPIGRQLREAAPDGVDAVFDNVGGEQLAAALASARHGARIALIGALEGQMGTGFTSPVEIDSASLVMRGITLRGLRGADHLDGLGRFQEEFTRGMRAGTLTFPCTRLTGVEEAPRALCELLEGRHTGAVLVDL